MRILLLTLLFSMSTFAISNQFKIAGKFYAFNTKGPFLVNSSCKDQCVALNKAKSIKKKITPKKKKFASSIGSYACTEVLNGQSVLGIKENKDMVAVCLFKQDSSMIEINSLSAFIEAL